MKTTIILGTLLCSLGIVAQNSQKATVRIKKIENVNGVEKVTDTTYTTDNVQTILMDDEIAKPGEIPKMKKIIIKSSEFDKEMSKEELDKKLKELTEEMEKQNKELTEREVIEIQGTNGDKKNVKTIKRMVIVKVDLNDASDEELKRMSTIVIPNRQLVINDMNFYPNPTDNGKFNLSFNLKEHGDLDVRVYDINGKEVYTEHWPGFEGKYEKLIDLGNEAKGVYFVKVQQGGNAQVKKLIVQ